MDSAAFQTAVAAIAPDLGPLYAICLLVLGICVVYFGLRKGKTMVG